MKKVGWARCVRVVHTKSRLVLGLRAPIESATGVCDGWGIHHPTPPYGKPHPQKRVFLRIKFILR